jgi:hypothetical protein
MTECITIYHTLAFGACSEAVALGRRITAATL